MERGKASARTVATRALKGDLPNPGIGLASEFASTRIFFRQRHGREPTDQEFQDYTRALARQKNWEFIGDVPHINSHENAFFLDNRARGLPPEAVRVVPPEPMREAESFEEDESLAELYALTEEESDELRR